MNNTTITATLVPSNKRATFLHRHLGSLMLVAEAGIYQNIQYICKSYEGGYWHFYELSNNGFYMAPDMEGLLPIFIPSNGYEGMISADAAGIIATLYVLNGLCWKVGTERLNDQYYQLRDYIHDHPEACEIFAAID